MPFMHFYFIIALSVALSHTLSPSVLRLICSLISPSILILLLAPDTHPLWARRLVIIGATISDLK